MNTTSTPREGTSVDKGDGCCPPLIITGMHRSGTSLTASLFASAGLHVGDRMLGAHAGNPLGHFEDLDFLEFHILALRSVGDDENGYTGRPVRVLPASQIARADALVSDRSTSTTPWGWKDPRTTLFLDFWADRVPDARFLFVFRNAADVADSLFRRGDWWFVHHPLQALEIWRDYNRLIVDFVSLHPDRSCVVEIDDLIGNPKTTLERVTSTLGLSLGDPATLFRPDLFGKDSNPQGSTIAMAVTPEVNEIYADLRRLSELHSPRRRRGTPSPVSRSLPSMDSEPAVRKLLIREWARASRAEATARDARGKEAVSSGEVARVNAELAVAADRLQRLEREHAAAGNEVQRLEEALACAAVQANRSEEVLTTMKLRVSESEEALSAATVRNRQLEDAVTAAALQTSGIQTELATLTERCRHLETEFLMSKDRGRQLEESLCAMTTQRQRLEEELAEALTWLPRRYNAVVNWIRSRLGSTGRARDAETAPVPTVPASRRRKVA